MMKISKQSFTISTNELEGRLDPFYYQEEFLEMQKKLQSINYSSVSKLSTKVLDGIHKTPKYAENGLIFLQANNINEGTIDFTKNIKYISNEWKEEVLRRYTPKAGDVLITKDGTIGVSATVPNNFEAFSIFVSVLAIRPKQEVIIPEFLRIMISSSIVQQQILQSTKGAVISHLLIGEAKKLKIPLPPKEIQTKIIQIMDSAYKIKKEKEEKAKTLLNSIDTYLLEKLDITLPKEEKVVSFEVSSSDVLGGRFDSDFNKPFNKLRKECFINSKYKSIIIKDVFYIARGRVISKQYIDMNKGVYPIYSSQTSNNGVFGKIKTYDFDGEYITWTTDGIYAGTCTYRKGKFNCTNICGTLKSKREDINLRYISDILNQITKQYVTKVANPKLMSNIMGSIKIPLPPLNIQNEIASHIEALRYEAKQLKQEAKEVLKKAKDEVEGIIL